MFPYFWKHPYILAIYIGKKSKTIFFQNGLVQPPNSKQYEMILHDISFLWPGDEMALEAQGYRMAMAGEIFGRKRVTP